MAFFAGAVNLLSPGPIGSTTPSTGAFTTLDASNGTLTSSVPAFTLSQTWNSAGVTFTALRANVTDTASASGSLLMDLQVGGASKFYVQKDGNAYISNSGGALLIGSSVGNRVGFLRSGGALALLVSDSTQVVNFNGTTWTLMSSAVISWSSGNISIANESSGVLAQRNSTNAQTFRLYNTYTDASNYERGFMQWSSNVLAIGAEAAGTGTQRSVEFRIGATAVLTLSGTQGTFAGRVSCNNLGIASNFLYSDAIGNGFRITDSSGFTSASGGLFLYNSYTNTTNNERGFMRWGSNRFQVGTISIGTGTARSCEITLYTSASDPTSSDITSGYFSVWKNSGTGTIKLWVNDGGTMKSVALA